MPLFSELDVYRDAASRSAAMNMAIDEALLERAQIATLRFYQWDHPAISFGYFGKFADVARHVTERDLVRRWTGGGTVFHGEDLTYSVVIPSSIEEIPSSSLAVYAEIHEALRKALEEAGHAAELLATKTESEQASDSCFANPVAADILSHNRKVAGAAHRRTRAGLLHQGSIQNIEISQDLASAFAGHLSPVLRETPLNAEIIERAQEIAETKYATAAWLHRW
jgi:lipoate-protein ligase A